MVLGAGLVGQIFTIVIAGGIVALYLSTFVICLLKGYTARFVIGLFIPLVQLFGAFAVARPNSWWSRNVYDDARRAAVLKASLQSAGAK